MTTILDRDYLTDAGYLAHKVLREENLLPDYAKNWVVEQEKLASTHANFWGGTTASGRNVLPTFDKSSAFHSYLYLLAAAPEDLEDYVVERVTKAADAFGVREDVETAWSTLFGQREDEQAKQASSTPAPKIVPYALEIDPEGENVPRFFYPLDTVDNIKEAALDVMSDYGTRLIPFPLFREASKNIMREALIKGASQELPSRVYYLGALLDPAPDRALDLLHTREKYIQGTGLDWADFEPRYKAAVEAAQADLTETEKSAEAWCNLDEEMGLRNPYPPDVTEPYDAFFRCADNLGARYNVSEVNQVKLAKVQIDAAEFLTYREKIVPEGLFLKASADLVTRAWESIGHGHVRQAQATLDLLDEADQKELLSAMLQV